MKTAIKARDKWAKLLNGLECGSELSKEEAAKAKADGVLIIFGASDDNVELRGIINEEIGAYNGTEFHVTADQVLETHDADECDCKYCGYAAARAKAHLITAEWSRDGYSWWIQPENFDLPHSTFDILDSDLDDGEKFCRGIVIDKADLEKAP